MKNKRYNIDDVNCDVWYIPDCCAFCENKPIAILKIQKLFLTRKYWLCKQCRIKWIKGELIV